MDILNFIKRLKALVRKEFTQLFRDNSSLLIGIVLPILLIILIGSGISLDVKNVPVAVVIEDNSPTVNDMLSSLDGSDYFSPQYVTSMKMAEDLMYERKVDGILRIPPDFTEKLARGNSPLQLILYGTDSSTATTVQGYVEGVILQWSSAYSQQGTYSTTAYAGTNTKTLGMVTVESRMWFNDANTSTWYFIPGLMMMIMTIVGVFLTALVMAREWERGTLEAIFVTPMHLLELILSKMIPYFCIAMMGFFLCLAASYFVYDVPIQGSLWLVILVSMLYLFVALGMGLIISTITKNQFLASQVSLVASFMPSMMLTGFIFDLRSVPEWISAVGQILPATYYLRLLKSLMLAGNNYTVIMENGIVLCLYAIFFLGLAFKLMQKRVD